MKIHEKYIKRCIQLAKNGLGTTYSNPLVGSVIVHNGKIIGEGWHYQAGQPHAEVNAINSVKNKSLLKQATIYVSLEPCSHYGKTPPCSHLITKHKIQNVVIGCIDSFSEVSGNGIKHLENQGCNVTMGILEQECLELNKRFFTFHNKRRPYIILKWAESADGFIAPENNSGITWITNSYSRQRVHQQRTQEQSVLIGTTTALTDNPKLNVRSWHGSNPVRIVIDRELKIPSHHHIFNGSQKTIIITAKKATNNDDAVYETINFKHAIAPQICDILYKHQLQSVIIEGGTTTIQQFIDEDLWDEIYRYQGSNNFYKGVAAPIFSGTIKLQQAINQDTLTIYKP